MIGLVGAMTLSLIPILMGEWKRGELVEEEKLAEGMLKFLEHLEFRIRVFSHSQERIVSDFENRALEKSGFLPFFRKEIESNPCGALHRSMLFFLDESKLPATFKEPLLSFSENFGMQSKEGQLKDCVRALEWLNKEEEKGRERRENQKSIARALGLCAGMGIFILLI